MKYRIKTSTAVAALMLIGASVFAQAETYPQVRIPNSEERALYSKIMDYEYGVYVTLPPGYSDNPDEIYPSLYIIDGNQYFGFTLEPYGSLIWGNMVKDHIAISVAYRPGQTNYRSRDFRTSERAADFLRFFQDELIPFVEEHYRTSEKDRTLFGHSLGGHFTLYTLLNAPGTFDNYIASAPAVSDEIMKFEEDYAAGHDDFPVKLFLASGENDHLTIGAKRFAEKFKSRAYPGLKFGELYTPDGNHGTIQACAYVEGLRFVLDRAIELAPGKFERLTGSYADGDNIITVSYDGGNFLSVDYGLLTYDDWLGASMVEWSRIYPLSETSFISKGWPGTFEFGGDLSAPAESFEFRFRNKQIKARRK